MTKVEIRISGIYKIG
jgi:serine/threonine protein kinase